MNHMPLLERYLNTMLGLKVNTNGALGLANVVRGNLGVWNASLITVRQSQFTPYQVHEAH
jgi:hypothetical protein